MKKVKIIFIASCFSFNLFSQTGKAYFNLAVEKDEQGDYKAAIDAFTKCIELEPNLAEAYMNRGHSKNHLEDYKGAIEDFLMVIKLEPKYAAFAYSDIGLSKNNLEDYKGALVACTKSIELNPNIPQPWLNRAISKRALKQNDYCPDLKKAKELGDKNAIGYYFSACE
jgi:tetratricopeptide (TPR) repeat protein